MSLGDFQTGVHAGNTKAMGIKSLLALKKKKKAIVYKLHVMLLRSSLVFPWPCRALQSPRALRTGQQSPKDRANQLSGAVRLLFCSCLSDRKTVGPHMASTELGTITIELPRQRSSCCVPWNTGVLRITCKCAVIKWKTAFKSYGK